MNPTDRTTFVETVLGFTELRGKQLSAPALELYWRAMQHWCIEDFRAAAAQLLRTCEFMPLPMDFEDLRKAGRMTCGEAWADVLDFVRKGLHRGSSGRIPDPLTHRAVTALGGYEAIAMSATDRTHFLEKRFAEHYETIQDASAVRHAVPQIAYEETRRRMGGPQAARDVLPRLLPPSNLKPPNGPEKPV